MSESVPLFPKKDTSKYICLLRPTICHLYNRQLGDTRGASGSRRSIQSLAKKFREGKGRGTRFRVAIQGLWVKDGESEGMFLRSFASLSRDSFINMKLKITMAIIKELTVDQGLRLSGLLHV